MDQYYKSQEFREVLAQYEAIARGEGGFIDAADYADVAEYYLADSDEPRAYEAAQRGVEIFPDALAPLAVLARIELSRNHVDTAKQLIERAEDKDELEYFYVQAEIMIVEGKVQEAERFLASIESDDDPDDIALDIAAIFIDHNEFALARKWLEKVKNRSLPDAQDFEAHILTGEGRLEEGEKKVNELLDEDPYSTEHWNHLASVQYQKADYNASIESSDFALAINPDNAEALLNKANSFYALQNYPEALTFYRRFLKLRPDNVAACYYCGLTLAMLERHEQSVECLKDTLALALKNNDGNDKDKTEFLDDILSELAYQLNETGHPAEALQYLEQSLTSLKKREGTEEQQAQVYLIMAKVHLLKGDAEKTFELFERAREVCNTPETFVRMTAVVYECGYTEKAYEILGSVLFEGEGRDWTVGHAYLARYAYALGQKDLYKLLLLISLERNPAEAQFMLSDLYPAGTKPEDYPFTETIDNEEEGDDNPTMPFPTTHEK